LKRKEPSLIVNDASLCDGLIDTVRLKIDAGVSYRTQLRWLITDLNPAERDQLLCLCSVFRMLTAVNLRHASNAEEKAGLELPSISEEERTVGPLRIFRQ